MSIRRLGEAVLRPTSSTILPFLAPAVYTSSACRSSPQVLRLDVGMMASRGLHSSRRHLEPGPAPAASSEAAKTASSQPASDEAPAGTPRSSIVREFPAISRQQASNRRPAATAPSLSDNDRRVADLMDAITSLRTPKKSNDVAGRSLGSSLNDRGSSSADMLRYSREQDSIFSTSRRNNTHSPLAQRQGSIAAAAGLALPNDNSSILGSFADDLPRTVMRDLSRSRELGPLPPAVRLDPYIGRSITVARDGDLSRALGRMEIKCKQNQVKLTLNMQKYHERPGLKRKRLRRERWRKRFKDGFKAAITKVNRMRAQGW